MFTFTTRQQVFDHIARHLLTQGEKALGSHGDGVLVNAEGLTCAVGSLIPQEMREFYVGLGDPQKVSNIPRLLHPDITPEFLVSFVNLHDDADPAAWRPALTELAILNGLVIPEILDSQQQQAIPELVAEPTPELVEV